jgi:hypothetical protein
MKHNKFTVPALLVLALTSINAQANYDTVSLSGNLNTNLTTWTDGSAYSGLFSGTQTLGGIPFALSTDGNGNNAVYNPTSLTLSTNISDVTTVFTLINTAFGSYGSDVGSLTFHASNSDSFTVQLIEGVNVRDHFYGGFVNTLSDPTVTQAVFGVNSPGNAHLDMQTITLPVSFANETLTSVVFVSNQLGGSGQPFLAGLTLSAVPESEEWAMMLLGLPLIGWVARRKLA